MADNIATDYLQANRFDAEKRAGDELLNKFGLDSFGQEMTGAKPQPAATGALQHAAGAGERIRKIKSDQAKEPQPSFMKDVVGGTIAEVPRAIVGGVQDAMKEMLQSADSLADYFSKLTGTTKGGAFGKAAEMVPEVAGESTTPGGKLLRGISQFATGYATGGRVAGAAGVTGQALKPLMAGAFSDLAAFDPNDPNISNLINETFPALKNPLTEFLATDPKDGEALNRFKRAVEGLGLGVAMNAVVDVARNLRARTALKRTEAAFENAKAAPATQPAPATQAAEAAPTVARPAAAPSAASQVDVIRPQGSQDIPIGTSGQGGVMMAERKLLPAPGQGVLTADEIAENAAREARAAQRLQGNPTLQAAQEAVTIREQVRGNPTLRAAQETMLRGKSEEEIASKLLAKEGDTIRSILKDQGGEISNDMMYTLARATVGGAIGMTQGDTMEERISNAVLGAGVATALKPALLKKLIGAFERVAPREAKVIKSFDPPSLDVTAKGVPRKPPKSAGPLTVATEDQAKAFLAADPTAIEVGKKAIKVNWDEIGDAQAIDDVVKKLTKLNEESIDFARRGVQSDTKRQQLANMLGVTEDDMLRRRRGQALNAEQAQAFIDVYGSSIKEIDRLAVALKAGENVENQFRLQLGRTTALTEQIFGARAEAGRALRVWGQAAQDIGPNQLAQQIDMLTIGGKSLNDIPAERLADMVLALNTPAQKGTFFQQVTKLGNSAVLEAWMNGLLSNPVTHAANLISNSVTTFMGIAERGIAGAFGKEVARGEATSMIKGLLGSWREALDTAGRTFRAGESNLGFSKLEITNRAITAENLGVSGQFGRAVDMLGAVVSSPGRALMAADDFFKVINYRAELNAQAWRQASKEGGAASVVKSRAAELASDVDFASLVKDQAEGYAFYQTFNQSLGELGQGYLGFVGSHPWMRIITPFIRTPVNIAKYTLERTPLVNVAMNQVRADLRAGGVKSELALAKMAMGGMIFGSATALAMNDMITGGGPKNKDLKDLLRTTGWQPYSLKIGDTYISYSRFDPMGFILGLAADLKEKGGELKDGDIDSLATAGVVALHDTFVNKTYLSGVANLMNAIDDPGRFSTNYIQRLAGSLVPAGLGQLARQFDPTLREINSAADAIYAKLPGFSDTLPPRRNIWGEPIQMEGALGPDLISPFYKSSAIHDSVVNEMERLDLSVRMWPKYVYGTRPTTSPFAPEDAKRGINLLPEEYNRFVELAGRELKIDGANLHERLQKTIDSQAYKTLSKDSKETTIRQIFNAYGNAAEKRLILETPELQDAIKQKEAERMAAQRTEVVQ